jgi:alpha-maltose-1-phosphate synthase
MNVCIGSPGRFHTFDLAGQIERRGHLTRLYTAFPRFKVDTIPARKVSSFPWLMTPALLANRLGLEWISNQLNLAVIETYDRWMAAHLEPCDVFHCLSGFGVKAHRAARERYGAITICDRGSSHIEEQDRLLAEEYQRFGVPWNGIDRRVMDREMEEYASCDLVMVPSSFSRRTFIERGVAASKLRLNPYGVDLSMFRHQPRRDDKFRVMYAGAISIRKGIAYLLEACANGALGDAEVCLAGAIDPEIRPLLAKYEGSFHYLGVVPRAQLYLDYGQASVLVLPSIEDGFGLVMAQAMACGVPIIASANTGGEDLIDDGVEGFIVPIRNPRAIRERLVQLRDDPDLRERMAQHALVRVRGMGGWDSYGDRAEQIYNQALEARRAA